MKKSISRFRKTTVAKGISFLGLSGIAIPLKYFADLPVAVIIAGSLHGILFIAFPVPSQEVKNELNKNFKWYATCFLAAILSFGAFVLDKKLKNEPQQSVG